jgi:sugar O-acyltransferase (sialic acid O-acetyltransferase NeuD family)
LVVDTCDAMNSNIKPTRTESLVLVGGGGHALVVAEAAGLSGFHLPGYLDDHPLPALARKPGALNRLGGFADIGRIAGRRWILAIGNVNVRRTVLDALMNIGEGGNAQSVIHPTAYVSATATIGRGVYIGPGAVVHSRALIGDHAIVNTGVIVEHECVVGPNTHLAPGVVLAGGVNVGHDTLVGVGSKVLPTLSIGNECVIGAGSVVLRSVPEKAVAMGVPAQIRREQQDKFVSPGGLLKNA